jgi:hypothetical protein
VLYKTKLSTQKFHGQIEHLKRIVDDLYLSRVEPEMLEKLEKAQSLLGELYLNAEKRMKKVAHDYSFLSRDHVFFDGDHEHHSGAV